VPIFHKNIDNTLPPILFLFVQFSQQIFMKLSDNNAPKFCKPVLKIISRKTLSVLTLQRF